MEEGTKASCPLALSPALERGGRATRGRPRGDRWPDTRAARVTGPGTEPGRPRARGDLYAEVAVYTLRSGRGTLLTPLAACGRRVSRQGGGGVPTATWEAGVGRRRDGAGRWGGEPVRRAAAGRAGPPQLTIGGMATWVRAVGRDGRRSLPRVVVRSLDGD